MRLFHAELALRAEHSLCLSRAFLPPLHMADREALQHDLMDDLTVLGPAIGMPDATLAPVLNALKNLPKQPELLATYSRLFLAPPAPALLNLGFYLDGAVFGTHGQQIGQLYARWNQARHPDFHDAPDHLALYLHFLGWALAQTLDWVFPEGENAMDAVDITPDHPHAASIMALFTDIYQSLTQQALPALQAMYAAILKAEREKALFPLYGVLVTLTHDALHQEAMHLGRSRPSAPSLLLSEGGRFVPVKASAVPENDVACTACGTLFLAEPDLAGMIAMLTAQGLSTDHMQRCPQCRTSQMGFSALKAPKIKHNRRSERL